MPDRVESCSIQGPWRLARRNSFLLPVQPEMAGERPEEERLLAPWPLLARCRQHGTRLLAILCFALEGNNIADAVQLVSAAARYLQLPVGSEAKGRKDAALGSWCLPESWKYVYGPPSTQQPVY